MCSHASQKRIDSSLNVSSSAHSCPTGTIPTQIGNLKRLHTLALSSNFLSGTVPPQIGGMDILRSLQLDENQLSGSLPDIFGQLSHIEIWDTYGNTIHGDLPPSIMNASTLEQLYVQPEQSGPLRNFRCGERIPGLGNAHESMNVPSSQFGAKYNWVLMVADYFNMVYTTTCVDAHDVEFSFNALSGGISPLTCTHAQSLWAFHHADVEPDTR